MVAHPLEDLLSNPTQGKLAITDSEARNNENTFERQRDRARMPKSSSDSAKPSASIGDSKEGRTLKKVCALKTFIQIKPIQ